MQEPYDPVNFVERVATKCEGGGTKGGADAFDPVKLKEYFEETTKSLQQVMTQTQGRISKLERVCRDQEKQHKANAEAVEKQFKVIFCRCHQILEFQLFGYHILFRLCAVLGFLPEKIFKGGDKR